MTTPGRGCFASLVLIVWAAALSVQALPQAGTHTIPLAGSPPMGWNSWDCYGTSVTEAQVKGNADYMSKNLLSQGWQYIVLAIQWCEPNARAGGYNPEAHLEMDKYGRLIPAVNRFPSSADGKGFKPLADYIHSLGLKFGIHIMRGTPRLKAPRCMRPISPTSIPCAAGTTTCTASRCPGPELRRTTIPSSGSTPDGGWISSRPTTSYGPSIATRLRRFTGPS